MCIAGGADIFVSDRKYRLECGDVFVLTPLVQVYDFVPDAEFSFVSFIDELKVYYPIFRLISDTMIPWLVRANPCWRLSEEEMVYVIGRNDRIELKRKMSECCDSVDKRIVLSVQMELIKRETMLEIVGNHISCQPIAMEPAIGAMRWHIVLYSRCTITTAAAVRLRGMLPKRVCRLGIFPKSSDS